VTSPSIALSGEPPPGTQPPTSSAIPWAPQFTTTVDCRLRRPKGRPATLVRMDIKQIVSALTAELNRINQAIAALEGSSPRLGRPPKSSMGKRTMSASARARISAAQKARWAKQKGTSAPKKASAPAKKVTARKPMSPAARKKLSALAKARWAAAKKAGAKAL
jgi:hypothetical protein